jgi:hypothetical protein
LTNHSGRIKLDNKRTKPNGRKRNRTTKGRRKVFRPPTWNWTVRQCIEWLGSKPNRKLAIETLLDLADKLDWTNKERNKIGELCHDESLSSDEKIAAIIKVFEDGAKQ